MTIRKVSIRNSKFQPRASHVPIVAGRRPEILFVCRCGFAAETLITMLKCAEYSITYAETKPAAMDWLSRRRFQAIIVESSVPEGHELQAEGESRGIPIIWITVHRNGNTSTGITAESVKALLASVFALVPLDWVKLRKPMAASA